MLDECDKPWPLQSCTGHAATGVLQAMRAMVNAVTTCKFEATDPASDEVTLFRILQVCAHFASWPARPTSRVQYLLPRACKRGA